jgi:hypothetical protein
MRPREGAAGRWQATGTAEDTQRTPILAEVGAERKQGERNANERMAAGGANLHGPKVAAICTLMAISRRGFYLAQKLLRVGCAELIAEVDAGRMSLNLALQVARCTHDGQRLILAAIDGLAPRERTRMVRLILLDAEQGAAR